MMAFLISSLLSQVSNFSVPPEWKSFDPQGQVVFEAAPGQWDARIRERGWILMDRDRYLMWYTGYKGAREDRKMLGLATSSDGVTWTRHPRNPLVSDSWVEDMMVLKHENKFLMFAEGEHDIAQQWESADGVTWKRIGPLDIRKKNGQPIDPGPYGTPTVFFENGTWNLFYERRDRGIWLAKSKDRKVWTHFSDQPVLIPGPQAADRHLIAVNQIVGWRGRYFAWYHGLADSESKTWHTCLASSANLVEWTKYRGNPVVPGNRSSGIVVETPRGWVLYTMHDVVRRHEPKQ